jgi:hypothetical protein
MGEQLEEGFDEMNKGVFPATQLTFAHKNFVVKQSFKSLKIYIASGEDIVIKTISANEAPRIRVFAFVDPNNQKRLDFMLDKHILRFDLKGQKLEVTSDALRNNSCVKIRLNNDLSGKGSCYQQVIVELPEGSHIVVRDQKNVLNSEVVPFDKEEMISMVKSGMLSADKIKVLESELNKISPSPILSAEDVRTVLKEMMLDSDKKTALVVMIDYINLTEVETIASVIDDEFSFDHDTAEAHKLLLRKISHKE